MPNLENRDTRNGTIAEKEMRLDAFPSSFRSLTLLALCGSRTRRTVTAANAPPQDGDLSQRA
jgi:hypothetical protein